MLYHSILLENLIEHREGTSAIDHEIFRDDFEPADHRLALEDVVVVRDTQPDTHSVFGEAVKAIGRHSNGTHRKTVRK